MSDPAKALRTRISVLLGDALGATPGILRFETAVHFRSPIFYGIAGGLTYVVVFSAVPWFLGAESTQLLLLSAWGGFYFFFATVIAQSTSNAVTRRTFNQIIPQLGAKTLVAIEGELSQRFGNRRLDLTALVAASLATAASVVALRHDLPDAPWKELLFWCCGFFILYFPSARTTDVARFYGVFSSHLAGEVGQIHALNPARAPLVAQVSSLGRQILMFWFGIACSVATLVALFGELKWFVLLVTPTASFFSLALGTLIFLKSERDISDVVDSILIERIQSTDRDIAELFARRTSLSPDEWTRMRELQALRDRIFSDGWYHSVVARFLSIAAPFVAPLVSILSLLKGK